MTITHLTAFGHAIPQEAVPTRWLHEVLEHAFSEGAEHYASRFKTGADAKLDLTLNGVPCQFEIIGNFSTLLDRRTATLWPIADPIALREGLWQVFKTSRPEAEEGLRVVA